MKYKISIIVPIYNVEEYLEDAIQSILIQTIGIENLQVILVNDGSTDSSQKIIDEYCSKHDNFVAIQLKEKSGAAGVPRNKGIDIAEGKYIMFLDPDDIYDAEACEILYEAIEKYNNIIVSGQYLEFNSKGSVLPVVYKTKLKDIKENVSVIENPDLLVSPPSVCIRIFNTNFLKKNNIRFLPKVSAQDAVFTTEILMRSEYTTFIPKVIYKYRKREDDNNLSVTQNVGLKYFKEYVFTRKEIMKIYTNYNKLDYYKVSYIPDIEYASFKFFSNEERISPADKVECLKVINELLDDNFDIYKKNIKGRYANIILPMVKKELYDEVLEFIKLDRELKNNSQRKLEKLNSDYKKSLKKSEDELYKVKNEVSESIKLNRELKNNYEKKLKKLQSDYQKRLKKCEDELFKIKKENNLMKSSNSWKVTEPLRKVGRIIKSIVS